MLVARKVWINPWRIRGQSGRVKSQSPLLAPTCRDNRSCPDQELEKIWHFPASILRLLQEPGYYRHLCFLLLLFFFFFALFRIFWLTIKEKHFSIQRQDQVFDFGFQDCKTVDILPHMLLIFYFSSVSLHTVDAPAVRAAAKTVLSWRHRISLWTKWRNFVVLEYRTLKYNTKITKKIVFYFFPCGSKWAMA